MNQRKPYSVLVLLLCVVVSYGSQSIKEWDPQFDMTVDGEYCQYGEYEGTPLYWRALWEPYATDTPGGAMDSGRANPWVPVNSLAFTKGEEYQWVGWNSGCTKYRIKMNYKGKELEVDSIGTWGDQIDTKGPGAYIPTWRDGAEGAYTLIMDDVGAMNYEGSIEPAIDTLKKFPWCKIGFAVKVDAMSDEEWEKTRGMVLDGHEILNHSYDHLSAVDLWQEFYHGDTIPTEDPSIPTQIRGLVVDTSLADGDPIEAICKKVSYKNADPMKPESLIEKMTYLVSEYVPDPNPDTEMNIWHNLGKIEGSHLGADPEIQEIVKMVKVKCYTGWSKNCREVNVDFATELINSNVYLHDEIKDTLSNSNAVDEVVSYAFPYNQSSNGLIRYITEQGYLSSRGGANWGEPLSGDFYDPFRLNYDEFVRLDQHATKVWPDNPFMKVGLQEMPNVIAASKGYMIRQIYSINNYDPWEQTGPEIEPWWGWMPAQLFKKHLLYLDTLRQHHKLYVAPPTEVVKYRLTANAAKSASVDTVNKKFYKLSLIMGEVDEEYQDEISVIVTLGKPLDSCVSRYVDEGKKLRYQPRKMDEKGYSWSISINPYIGDVYFGDPGSASVISGVLKSEKQVSLQSTHTNHISLFLPKGNFKSEILSPAGKLVSEKSITSTGGTHTLSTAHVGQGIYFLCIKADNQLLYKKKLLIQ